MKHLLTSTALILLFVSSAHAAQPLTERQMDRVAAGQPGTEIALANAVATATGPNAWVLTQTLTTVGWNPTMQKGTAYAYAFSQAQSH